MEHCVQTNKQTNRKTENSSSKKNSTNSNNMVFLHNHIPAPRPVSSRCMTSTSPIITNSVIHGVITCPCWSPTKRHLNGLAKVRSCVAANVHPSSTLPSALLGHHLIQHLKAICFRVGKSGKHSKQWLKGSWPSNNMIMISGGCGRKTVCICYQNNLT